MKIHEKLEKSNAFYNQDDIPQAKNLLLDVENEFQTLAPSFYRSQIQANLGCLLIDLGAHIHDKDMIVRGKNYTDDLINKKTESETSPGEYYNLANGYNELWNMESQNYLNTGEISENYLNAKKYYRKSLDIAEKTNQIFNFKLLAQINTNLGNCLCSVGRDVEAFSYYDSALKFDKSLGMAYGNKAISLRHFSFLAYGHIDLFLLESRRLFEEALTRPTPEDSRRIFQKGYEEVNSLIQKFEIMLPNNPVNSEPESEFHKFLRDFCVKHQLYLTPTTFIGKESELFYGDPLFISNVVASIDENEVINRYILFLNQIKQDYILARYFLIQSQYRSSVVDLIDKDVSLYDPLDYSIYNAYIQLLKQSLKLTMDTFDKIAQFLREYCEVDIKAKKTQFRTIWTLEQDKKAMRPEFSSRKNKYLLALFDLAVDLKKDGYFQHIYDHRNAITHRFFSVYEIMMPIVYPEENSGISREDLLKTSITALQLLRAAVVYLILFVNSEEKRNKDPNVIYGPLPSIRISYDHQWKPNQGDSN